MPGIVGFAGRIWEYFPGWDRQDSILLCLSLGWCGWENTMFLVLMAGGEMGRFRKVGATECCLSCKIWEEYFRIF